MPDPNILVEARARLTRFVAWPTAPTEALVSVRLAKAPTPELLDYMDLLSQYIEALESEYAYASGEADVAAAAYEKVYYTSYLIGKGTVEERKATAKLANLQENEEKIRTQIYADLVLRRLRGVHDRKETASRILSARQTGCT